MISLKRRIDVKDKNKLITEIEIAYYEVIKSHVAI